MKPRRVAIVAAVIARHDAISRAVVATAAALESAGMDVALFTLRSELPELGAEVVADLPALLASPRFLAAESIFYHFGVHSPLMDAMIVGAGGARQIVAFHNITPAAFMAESDQPGIERSFRQLHNLRHVDRVWAMSPTNAKVLLDQGVDPAKIDVFPLPVEAPPIATLATKLGRPLQLLCVGRLVRAKGVLELIQTVRRLRDRGERSFRLRIVGAAQFSDPEYIRDVREASRSCGLSRIVQLVGEVSDRRLARLYREAHILALPTRHEGFGVPAIEALRAGCIPVGFAAGALPETLRGLGRLVAPGDEASLADALSEMMAALRCRTMLPLDRGPTTAEAFDWLAKDYVRAFQQDAIAPRIVALMDAPRSPARRAPTATAPIFVWVDHTAQPSDCAGGVQRTVRNLARGLQDLGQPQAFLIADDAGEPRPADAAALEQLARWNGPTPAAAIQDVGPTPGAWLLVPEIPYYSQQGAAVLDQVLAYARRNRMRAAVVLHDLIPVRQPGYDHLRQDHARYLAQIAGVDLVLPVSETVARDVRAYWRDTLGLAPKSQPQVLVCRLGEAYAGVKRGRGAPAAHATGPVRALAVGTIEPRKNQIALIRAFRRLLAARPQLDARLTLVGNIAPGSEEALRHAAGDDPRIELRPYLPDDEIAGLYRACDFTAFASIDEGFGMPLAESLWFGKPCLCADFGAMAETAAGGGCLTTDTRDEAALQRGLERLIGDASLRGALAQRAGARPLRSWSDYAADVIGALGAWKGLKRAYYYVDFTCRHPANTGVQRVARLLAASLARRGVELIPLTWDASGADFTPPSTADLAHLARWSGPQLAAAAPGWDATDGDWLIVPEILSPPQPSPSEVMARARSRGLRVAFLFYDLIPLKLSHLFSPVFTEGFANCWREMAAADLILPISEAAALDLQGFLDRTQAAASAAIAPIPLAGAFPDMRRVRMRKAERSGLILCVGTIDPRKNQLRVAEAFQRLRRADRAGNLRLVFVGSAEAFPDTAAQLRELLADTPAAELREGVDDDALRRLYEACDFTVYASSEEGFGLPIVESLWHGRPCICDRAGAIAETAGPGGCLMIDVGDTARLAEAMSRLSADDELYDRLAQEAVSRPIESWDAYASEVVDALVDHSRVGWSTAAR